MQKLFRYGGHVAQTLLFVFQKYLTKVNCLSNGIQCDPLHEKTKIVHKTLPGYLSKTKPCKVITNCTTKSLPREMVYYIFCMCAFVFMVLMLSIVQEFGSK